MKIPAPPFTKFRLKDTQKNKRNINPFHIQRALDLTAEKVKIAPHLNSRTVLVEMQNDKQLEAILKTIFPGSHPLQVRERHR